MQNEIKRERTLKPRMEIEVTFAYDFKRHVYTTKLHRVQKFSKDLYCKVNNSVNSKTWISVPQWGNTHHRLV